MTNLEKVRKSARDSGLNETAAVWVFLGLLVLIFAVLIPALSAISAVTFWIIAGYVFGAATMTFMQTWITMMLTSAVFMPFYLVLACYGKR